MEWNSFLATRPYDYESWFLPMIIAWMWVWVVGFFCKFKCIIYSSFNLSSAFVFAVSDSIIVLVINYGISNTIVLEIP